MSHLYPLKINNEKGSQYYNVFYQFICSVANDAAVKCLSYSSETSPTVMFSMQNIRKPLAYYNGHLSIYRLSPPDSITTVRKLHSCLWLDGWLLKFEAQCFHFAVTYMCSVGFWKGSRVCIHHVSWRPFLPEHICTKVLPVGKVSTWEILKKICQIWSNLWVCLSC